DLLCIPGILFFSNNCIETVQPNHLVAAVKEPDIRSFLRSILNLNHNRGNRNDANGQNGSSEKLVQETALAGLEPAEDRNIQDFFFRERPTAFDELVQRGDLVSAAQRRYGPQHFARYTRAASRVNLSIYWRVVRRTFRLHSDDSMHCVGVIFPEGLLK